MPKLGERFNPYRLFTGIFIPDAVVQMAISWGAKVSYGQLAKFAGRRGYAFPKQSTFAASLRLGERQARGYLLELEAAQLITIEKGGPGAASRYFFLWHPDFEQVINSRDGDSDRQDAAGLDRNDTAGLDRQFFVEEIQKTAGLIGRESGRESKRTPPTPPGGALAGSQTGKPKRVVGRARRREEILKGMKR